MTPDIVGTAKRAVFCDGCGALYSLSRFPSMEVKEDDTISPRAAEQCTSTWLKLLQMMYLYFVKSKRCGSEG